MQNEHVVLDNMRRHKKRQIRETVITTVVTNPRTTVTRTRTVLTVGPPPTTDRDTSTTSARTTSTTSDTSATPTSTSTTTVSTSSTPTSTTPTTTLPTTTATRPTNTATDRGLGQTSSASVLIETITSTSSRTPTGTSVGSKEGTGSTQSAGTIVGIVAGVLGGLIAVAIIAGFIVRRIRKKKLDREAFSSTFRKSALILNDKDAHTPRPPSMIERKRANPTGPPPAPSSAYPYSDVASQYSSEPHYGGGAGQFDRDGHDNIYNSAPNMYGGGGGASMHGGSTAYGAALPGGAPPIPYGGQNMYNQYPDHNYGGGVGYGAGVGAYGGGGPAPYAPYSQNPRHQQHQQQQYAPRGYPNYNGQQQHPHQHQQQGQYQGNFGPQQGQTGSAPVSPNKALPNPFTETSPMISREGSSGSSSSSHSPSRGGPQSDAREQEDAAPPAYSDESGQYVNLKRDQKTPVVMSPETGSRAATAATAPAAQAPAPAPAPATPAVNNNGGSGAARPLSTHTTIYDPNDAYGGM